MSQLDSGRLIIGTFSIAFAMGCTSAPAELAQRRPGDAPPANVIEGIKRMASEPRIKSPQDVIAALPEEMRENFTLIHDSQSIQDANLSHPRALMFSKDATSIATFNGHPKLFGYDSIEAVAFLPETNRFEFRAITFPPGTERPVLTEPNPSLCMGCHTGEKSPDDPRPNWQDYSQWPGVFGADDDRLSAEEQKAIDEFRRNQPNDPRYKHLIFRKGEENFPYIPKQGSADIKDRVNFRLTMLLARLNAKRLARMIQEKRFERFGEPWLFLALGCEPDTATRSNIERLIGKPLTKKPGNFYGKKTPEYYTPDQVLEAAGITPKDWNMKFRERPLNGNFGQHPDPTGPYFYSEGFWETGLFVADQYLQDLAKTDSSIAKGHAEIRKNLPSNRTALMPISSQGFNDTLDSLGVPAVGAKQTSTCSALAKRIETLVQKHTNQNIGHCADCRTTPVLNPSTQQLDGEVKKVLGH